jgi:peptidoglycan-associated lipoprotein
LQGCIAFQREENDVTNQRLQFVALAMVLVGMLCLDGCNKKVAKVTPPASPSPPAPTASLAATPSTVQQGQSTTLTWQTQNATEITIAGLGTVSASGSRSVTPSSSTTYSLTAKGAGGTQEASARVTVTPVPTAAKGSTESDEDLFSRNLKDLYFDFDKAEIRPDESQTANADAQFLVRHPNIKVVIEGHCDERGSEEYNLALGSNRADSLKKTLLQNGVSADRIRTVSYGKERPFCTQEDEQCWQQNRRDHFVFQR